MVAYWKPPTPLNGHIFSYGRTDSGKTWKLVAVIQFYHSQGYKIWDLWGGKRKEGGFWCFPSDEKKLWFDYTKEVGEMSSPGEKEYEVHLLYPLFVEGFADKIPEKKPRITSIPFTLFFKDVGIDEISTITGGLSKQAQGIWKKILKELPDSANGEDILEWFNKKTTKQFKKTTIYNSFIEPFCEAKILMDKDCPYNLNLLDEANDKNAVSILMDDYTPEEYKMFFILHILKVIYESGETDKIHRKHIALLRELNYFMKVQDESQQDSEQKQIMRNHFSSIARYGRSVILIAGDTQSPSEVKGLIEGQEDLLLLNQLPGEKDRATACDRLVSDGRMSPLQRDYLGSIEMTKEKMVVVERGQLARLVKRVQPPRTKCFKRIDGSFPKVWKSIYNEWKDVTEEKKKILDAYKLRKFEIQERKDKSDSQEEYDENEIDEEEEKMKQEEKDKKAEFKSLRIKQLEEEIARPLAI